MSVPPETIRRRDSVDANHFVLFVQSISNDVGPPRKLLLVLTHKK
jgi:hypothetical protein